MDRAADAFSAYQGYPINMRYAQCAGLGETGEAMRCLEIKRDCITALPGSFAHRNNAVYTLVLFRSTLNVHADLGRMQQGHVHSQ